MDNPIEAVKLLLDLPVGILVALGAGYLAYRLAFVGRDGHHGPIDVLFLALVFAAVVRWCDVALQAWLPPIWSPVPASLLVIAVALLWRRFVGGWTRDALRRMHLVDDDGQPNVWRSMLVRNLRSPTRLVVHLKDGSSVMCDRLAAFHQAPMETSLLGPDGSIALYITHVMSAGEMEWKECAPYDPEYADWGYEMSFIPASEIARVDITRPA